MCEYKIEYVTYNNFKQICFCKCKTREDVEKIMCELRKLKHVTNVTLLGEMS
jgi:hypothetical protein